MEAIPTEPSRPEEPTEPAEPRATGGLHIKPPPGMVLDDLGNLDLKGMMAKGLMPKPSFATVKVCPLTLIRPFTLNSLTTH